MRNSSHVLCMSLVIVLLGFMSSLIIIPDAQALPAFARKYNVNCTVCHTRPPQLNTFGERFLENGYQIPGTEDGGIVGKRRLGDLTLEDTVSNYMAFRLRGNAVRNFDYTRGDGASSPGDPEDRTELGFPGTFNLFTAGTFTRNVGFLVELESNFEASDGSQVGFERTFVSFNNIGSSFGPKDLAHLRIGKIDPSAFWSFPTHRQQLNPVRPNVASRASSATALSATNATVINRIPLLPSAWAAKFFGIFDRGGTAILPFEPLLFNTTNEMGVDIHGRPFGDWFLYQVGILNGVKEGFGDSNNPKDWFVMGRFDYAQSDLFSASLSGFGYFGNNNIQVRPGNPVDVSMNRYGLSTRVRYRMVDIYAAYTIDQIRDLPAGLAPNFDATATGLTVEADVLATDRLLLSARFDNLDAGGVRSMRKSNTILAFQGKYYLRTNIALFVRDDFNLREAEGGASAPRNFRNAFLVGADIIY